MATMNPENPAYDLSGTAPTRPKLLVVDDQPLNIQVMYQIFVSDCQIFMATSGEQALALALANPPDLILLDLVMPGMDGLEVFRRLKENPLTESIPVIFVTAHNDAEQEALCLDLGAADFIAKPVNAKVVRARVKTHLTIKYQSDLLRRLVLLDGLSGVFNRRYFDQQYPLECARATRDKSPLSVIMVDVDFFKLFNDCYGHQAGDDCLRQVASALRSCLKRVIDIVARYGGEEFVCILPDTPYDDALGLAWSLERKVRSLRIPHAASVVDEVVTVSIGLATHDNTSPVDAAALLKMADIQLYAAKLSGRGCVRAVRL